MRTLLVLYNGNLTEAAYMKKLKDKYSFLDYSNPDGTKMYRTHFRKFNSPLLAQAKAQKYDILYCDEETIKRNDPKILAYSQRCLNAQIFWVGLNKKEKQSTKVTTKVTKMSTKGRK